MTDAILTVEQMRAAEQAAMAAGTDGWELMQRAGRGAAGVSLQRQRNDQSRPGALRATGTRQRAGFATTRVEQRLEPGEGSSQQTDEYANFALGGAVHRLTASVGR